MNTPNPLVPQGSLERTSKSKSTVRIAILTIVSIHAVFFAGLLMQGCRRDETKTNTSAKSTETNNSLAALPDGTTPGYYTSTQDVAQAASTQQVVTPTPPPPIVEAPKETPAPTPLPTEPTAEGKAYKIAKGDTLAKIAKANGVTVGALTKANPNLEPSKLKVGQSIQIPVSGSSTGGIGFADPSKSDGAATSGSGNLYTVKAGETLTRIAKQHGVSVKAIRAANNLKTDRLLVGQKLKLPATTASAGTDSAKTSSVSKMTATNPAYSNPTTGGTTVR